MKRTVIAVAVGLLCLTSCSTLIKTSRIQDVQSSLTSMSHADLVVSPTKVKYTYVPEKRVQRGGLKSVKSFAVAELLRENGNADVLVEPQYEILMRKSKVKKIIVTGYPATYSNFKVAK